MSHERAGHLESDTAGRPADQQPDESEPTPGSDGDGAEPGYTPPDELSAHDAPVRDLDRDRADGP